MQFQPNDQVSRRPPLRLPAGVWHAVARIVLSQHEHDDRWHHVFPKLDRFAICQPLCGGMLEQMLDKLPAGCKIELMPPTTSSRSRPVCEAFTFGDLVLKFKGKRNANVWRALLNPAAVPLPCGLVRDTVMVHVEETDRALVEVHADLVAKVVVKLLSQHLPTAMPGVRMRVAATREKEQVEKVFFKAFATSGCEANVYSPDTDVEIDVHHDQDDVRN
ncbi:hypothetical protein BCR44DRAFT_43145 [Catenaria anguillulae PL171]|uniref:Uncharacterized protein n=1 Tax=Catenaria anguillulae PL171 TaxID=765915 RepID=A0A1Y2H8C0_9FUNG|nr:hypothetical protein BCR44DRAFT_43145 [Catenaria anguillulae PL171]